MRSVKFIMAAGAASLISSTAVFAADMAIAPPPAQMYAPPPVEDFGGWYLRGDVGMTNTKGNLRAPGYTDASTVSYQQVNHEFTSGTSYGVGVGYQFNSWFRADVTGEYRSKVNFSGSDFTVIRGLNGVPGNSPLGDTYNGGYSSWVAMVNGYVDLGTWWCVTPFIGAGIGGAYNKTSGLTDIATFPANNFSTSLYAANGSEKWNLAWAIHAGLAYKVSNNFTVELAYRYLDMGDGVTGDLRTFDGVNNINNPMTFKNITSHDLKLGVRWDLTSPAFYAPPPPPPLIRKG
jgi:opacity protein-like surface antigen